MPASTASRMPAMRGRPISAQPLARPWASLSTTSMRSLSRVLAASSSCSSDGSDGPEGASRSLLESLGRSEEGVGTGAAAHGEGSGV
jgi:hypothetical protein